MKKHSIELPHEGEERPGGKRTYSNEQDYSIGCTSGPHQNGRQSTPEKSSFSSAQKAETGLISRSPL